MLEPTLVDQTGHCHSFVGAVVESGPEQRFELWAGRRCPAAIYANQPQVRVHPHFDRRLRRPQAYWLLRRLLRAPGRIFVPTAGRADLSIAHWAAPGALPPGKASFFFHWIRADARKRAQLAQLARRQPDLGVLAGTEEIVALLREAGFRRARYAPYPLAPSAQPCEADPGFRHLLFAGAARVDKGFAQIVDLVERLAASGADLPLAVQTSARHYGKRDPDIESALERLERARYAALHTYPQTLDQKDYIGLFAGAICLQPYDRAEFAGRVSSVTVDALARGAPVITTAGTWMARAIERWHAGLALERPDGPALERAARAIIADYPRYSQNARRAAREVLAEHSARHLLDAVLNTPS